MLVLLSESAMLFLIDYRLNVSIEISKLCSQVMHILKVHWPIKSRESLFFVEIKNNWEVTCKDRIRMRLKIWIIKGGRGF